jgi:hypothetical protein
MGRQNMKRKYIIWWHTKFIDEINRDATTIKEILDKAEKTFEHLKKLKQLEDKGKIKVKETGTINPIIIDILDESVETDVINNPIVEVEE